MKNATFPECPICLKIITSDATLPNYCRLCGMVIDENNQKFCCEECKFRLKRILKAKKTRGEIRGRNNKYKRYAL